MSDHPNANPACEDVPMAVDFRIDEHARRWTDSAMALRPWRAEFFDTFAAVINAKPTRSRCRVLELGSGPGFLAERLLRTNPALDYVGLDFSAAMHGLARQRLGAQAAQVQFVERNLRDVDWGHGLGRFDAVVAHQVVHELRHKRHASTLHAQVRPLLLPGGSYLVCDHFHGEGGMANDMLYMTVREQRSALHAAGYPQVEQVLQKGGLVLHHAR